MEKMEDKIGISSLFRVEAASCKRLHSWAILFEYKTQHDRTWGLPKKNNT